MAQVADRSDRLTRSQRRRSACADGIMAAHSGQRDRPLSIARLGRRHNAGRTRTLRRHLESCRLDTHRPRSEFVGVARPVNRISVRRSTRSGLRLPTVDGPQPVLREISFDVRAGEIVAIIGRSGVGKTTLLRVLGGLLAGIMRHGDIRRHRVHARRQAWSWSSRTTAMHSCLGERLPATSSSAWKGGWPRRAAAPSRRRAADGRPREQRRRISVASFGWDGPADAARPRAWRLKPKVLLMDEPFGALDAITKAALQDVLLDCRNSTTDATVVFITHDLDEAIYLSDRVLVLAGTQVLSR